MSETLGEHAVSNVAAGIFRATSSIRGPTPALTQTWIQASWHHYQRMKATFSSRCTGILDVCIQGFLNKDQGLLTFIMLQVPLYVLTSENVPSADLSLMAELTPVRSCSQAELNLFQPEGKYTKGLFMTTLVISPN